jgi:hypothetical protein
MKSNQAGLTRLYNEVNSPFSSDTAVIEVRAAHIEIDRQILLAYGWSDIALDHGIFDVEISGVARQRFTISEQARTEVLRRLAALNHRYHQEELSAARSAAGRQAEHTVQRKRVGRLPAKKATATATQPQLFE